MFKNPFSFDGRIRRLEYGLSMIIYAVSYIMMLYLSSLSNGVGIVGLLILVPALWFVWAQGTKRCHDINKSGWWQLVPFFGFFLLFASSDHGNNSYGANPKNEGNTEGQFPIMDSGTLDDHLIK
jgi:uncharacterized membrane protein YhaH (DUF805 family)